ncbi:hypothetical protein, partial [Fibrobacter intestinalis]|uniref:hypothetical protein n=1 Tax=Fibrobacter intestinalis TaxID=28122 RepID=UPI0023F44394
MAQKRTTENINKKAACFQTAEPFPRLPLSNPENRVSLPNKVDSRLRRNSSSQKFPLGIKDLH